MKNYKVNSIENNSLSITGKSDSIIWKEAEVLKDFCSPWDDKEPLNIEFRALWDKNQLYFSFTVQDREVYIDRKDDSLDSIGNSDRVELFFRSDADLSPYYCLEIDPSPRVMDFKAYPNRDFDFDWNWPKNKLVVKSFIEDNKFTVEGAIDIVTLEELGLLKNNKIETGIFRAKYNKQEDNSYEPTWIPWVNPKTEEPDFHVVSSFGVLNLVEL